jgi:glycosyltransferase involved in cell wall biosynthesis
MKLSYAIPVCNEIDEIKRLLTFLIENKRDEDEIVIVYDSVNGTKEVREYLVSVDPGTSYQPLQDYPVRWYSYDFDGDFGKMKNWLTDMCTGDYVFQIDADEMVDNYLFAALPQVLEHNEVDVILVPRINTVEGLTHQHVSKWGWRVDGNGWVNFPDYQWRIYRNTESIRWKNRVHETLDGYKTLSHLPRNPEWCLKHHKTIDRQERQNKLYETL